MRVRTGMRVEETARYCDLVENSLRRQIPRRDLEGILDNIGLPTSTINMTYSNSAPIGSEDADILVSLNENHRPTADYVRMLRKSLPREFPGTIFSFPPADMVGQILNFGLPAPIDIQVAGRDVQANRRFADELLNRLRHVPGAADLRVHQAFNHPKLHVEVDRTKAAESGFTQRDVANSLLISLSGSQQTTPTFWLNPTNGVSYNLVTQTPQYRIQSLGDLRSIPSPERERRNRRSSRMWRPSGAPKTRKWLRTATWRPSSISTARSRTAIWAPWAAISSGS